MPNTLASLYRFFSSFAITLLLAISIGVFTAPSTFAHGISINKHDLTDILKKASPAVVQINVELNPPDIRPEFSPSPSSNTSNSPATPNAPSGTPQGSAGAEIGTGIIFDAKKGLILTNAHVVDNAQRILVTLKNGSRYFGHVVAIQKDHDIAILHINASHLQAMPLANMNQVHVGNFVIAIGTPFGLSQSVSTGTISALNRTQPKIVNIESLIQTDAAVNPGNSGGPLINTQGQLVGMNTALYGPGMNIGIGFAIPVDIIQSITKQLIKYGDIKQGLLGVIAEPITGQLASALQLSSTQGTLITEVLPNSAAAKAHIKPGDVITQLNQRNIDSALTLSTTTSLLRPNTHVIIHFIRNHQKKIVSAVLQSTKTAMSHIPTTPFVAGLQLQSIHEFTMDGKTLDALLVTHVSEDSTAFLAGVIPGDVLMSINGKATPDITSLKGILARIPESQPQTVISIYRQGKLLIYPLSRS